MKIWKINIELDDAGDPREYYSWNALASLFFAIGYNFGGDHSELHNLGIIRQWIAKLS